MLEWLQNLTLIICLLRFGGLAAQCVREAQSHVTAVELVTSRYPPMALDNGASGPRRGRYGKKLSKQADKEDREYQGNRLSLV